MFDTPTLSTNALDFALHRPVSNVRPWGFRDYSGAETPGGRWSVDQRSQARQWGGQQLQQQLFVVFFKLVLEACDDGIVASRCGASGRGRGQGWWGRKVAVRGVAAVFGAQSVVTGAKQREKAHAFVDLFFDTRRRRGLPPSRFVLPWTFFWKGIVFGGGCVSDPCFFVIGGE